MQVLLPNGKRKVLQQKKTYKLFHDYQLSLMYDQHFFKVVVSRDQICSSTDVEDSDGSNVRPHGARKRAQRSPSPSSKPKKRKKRANRF